MFNKSVGNITLKQRVLAILLVLTMLLGYIPCIPVVFADTTNVASENEKNEEVESPTDAMEDTIIEKDSEDEDFLDSATEEVFCNVFISQQIEFGCIVDTNVNAEYVEVFSEPEKEEEPEILYISTQYKCGEQLDFEVQATEGYELSEFFVLDNLENNISYSFNSETNIVTFTMPEVDVFISAVFTEIVSQDDTSEEESISNEDEVFTEEDELNQEEESEEIEPPENQGDDFQEPDKNTETETTETDIEVKEEPSEEEINETEKGQSEEDCSENVSNQETTDNKSNLEETKEQNEIEDIDEVEDDKIDEKEEDEIIEDEMNNNEEDELVKNDEISNNEEDEIIENDEVNDNEEDEVVEDGEIDDNEIVENIEDENNKENETIENVENDEVNDNEEKETEESKEDITQETIVDTEEIIEEDFEDCDEIIENEEAQLEEDCCETEDEFITPTDFLNAAKLPQFIKYVWPSLTSRPMSFKKARLTEGAPLVKNEFLHTSKTINYDSLLDEYFLRLEVFLRGEDRVEKRIPSDIVLVLDQSGSMDYCFDCGDDNADSRKYSSAYYNGLIVGSMEEEYEYWCWNKDNTEIIQVYYCDNGENCKYVDANGNKLTHTPRWATSDHRVETTVSGTYYIPGPTNSPNLTSKIFYKTSECKPEDAYYPTVNEDGDICFGKFSSKGTYYYNTSFARLYWCEYHGAWFTKSTCNSTNHKTTNLRYPKYSSSDKNYRGTPFYEALLNHPVYSAKVDTTQTYRVNYTGRGIGMPYAEISYCSDCSAWHVSDEHSSTHYTPKKSSGASAGTVFYGSCTMSRGDALKLALNGFLTSIYDDSVGKDGQFGTSDDVHNRIAIAGFGASDTKANVLLSYAVEADTEATTKTYLELYGKEEIAADPMGGTPNIELFSNSLHDVSTLRGQSIINSSVDNLIETSNTEHFKGLRIASDILSINQIEEGEERNRVVVLFTDGQPESSLAPGDDKYSTSTSFRFCDAALNYAHEIKSSNTTIYTIGIFSGANASNMLTTVGKAPRNNANKFMHLISSNFLNAVDSDIAYTADDVNPNLQSGESFYLSASSISGLNDIFATIAVNIKGNAAYIKTMGGPSVIQDIVSDNFTLKYGDDTSKIRVHTEAYMGTSNEERIWEDDNNTAVDETLAITIGDDNQKVQVSGFNYTEFYVATDTKIDGTIEHRGRRIIIEIPIAVAERNLGGLMQSTNTRPNSSVYDENGLLVEDFDMPYMDVPTYVTVKNFVEGRSPDYNKNFNFKVEYEKFETHGNEFLQTENDSNYLNTSTTTDETSEFQLKHDEGETFTGVQCGTKIKISEFNTDETYNHYYYIQYPDGTVTEKVMADTEFLEIDVVEGMEVVLVHERKTVLVEIHKTDYENVMTLDGAKMQIIDEHGTVVEEFETTKEAYVTTLPYGKYVIHEEYPPDAYYDMPSDIEFEVKAEDEKVVVETRNIPIVELPATGGRGNTVLPTFPVLLAALAATLILIRVKKKEN